MAKAKIQSEEIQAIEPVDMPNKENLQAVLIANPHVHVIHVNDNGEWHFMSRPGFKAYEREDILNG